MAALPNGMPPGTNAAALPNGMPPGANAAIKAKISSNSAAHAPKETSNEPSQGASAGYDPNAYLYDANSWPEYTIHDSDYSNFRSVEMNNMNGENTDMPNYDKMMVKRPSMPGYQNMDSEGEMEFQGPKFPQEKPVASEFNDELKQQNSEPLQRKPLNEGSQADKANSGGIAPVAGDVKAAADSGNKGVSKSESSSKPAPGPAQQSPQAPAASKVEGNAPAAKDAPSQKQQQKQQQQQPQAKATPGKLAESVAQAAASLPPKAIASLVSSLVGGGKVVGTTAGQLQGQNQGQGQIQKNVAGSVSQSLIPQDINPAEEQTQTATQLHKVEKPKKQ